MGGGEGVLVLAVGRRVGEERGLEGVERGGSEEAFGRGEGGVEGQEEGGEEVKQGETEQLRLEEDRRLPHEKVLRVMGISTPLW